MRFAWLCVALRCFGKDAKTVAPRSPWDPESGRHYSSSKTIRTDGSTFGHSLFLALRSSALLVWLSVASENAENLGGRVVHRTKWVALVKDGLCLAQ